MSTSVVLRPLSYASSILHFVVYMVLLVLGSDSGFFLSVNVCVLCWCLGIWITMIQVSLVFLILSLLCDFFNLLCSVSSLDTSLIQMWQPWVACFKSFCTWMDGKKKQRCASRKVMSNQSALNTMLDKSGIEWQLFSDDSIFKSNLC